MICCQRTTGAEPNMLDFHMWPMFERVPYIDVLLPKEYLPKLNQWTVSMRELDAVKATGALFCIFVSLVKKCISAVCCMLRYVKEY